MREKNWVIIKKAADYKALSEKYGVEPMLLLLAKNRGIQEEDFEEFFNPTEDKLHDPAFLMDAYKAVIILKAKIAENKKIRVIGDYDIDGVCATTILTMAFKDLGADVDYAVPHRINDGYGLNMHLVDAAIEDGVDTIVTCDNGIAAYDEIAYAESKGLTVIVTDHHEIPYEMNDKNEKTYKLPPAQAVIDIKRADETYPYKDICGAAVAWKLVTLLERVMGTNINTGKYIELAGFATIGDVMVLQGENRTMASLGLKAMKNSAFPGIKALLGKCEIDPATVKCYHVGFRLGPCINATGRLDSADRAIKLLMTTDSAEAAEIAAELNEFNVRRQELTQAGLNKAIEQIEKEGLDNDKVLVLYLQNIHESIAGIIAGKVKEQYYKPTIVITDGEDGAKGSGRSIEGYSMFEKLNECKELFTKFGGHPMAAGLSLEKENIVKLRKFLNDHCDLDEKACLEKVKIDVVLPLSYLDVNKVMSLDKMEPVGNGNSGAHFALKEASILKITTMGSEKQHVRIELTDGTAKSTAIMWSKANELAKYLAEKYSESEYQKALEGKPNNMKLDVIYAPSINTWNGKSSVQLQIKEYR